MKLIYEDKERAWYLVKEWTTEAGLLARIHQCVWVRRKEIEQMLGHHFSLHDHYCGYVKLPEDDTTEYYDSTAKNYRCVDTHGGVTFQGELLGDESKNVWVGFDMAHYGDERKIGEYGIAFAEKECEELAAQLKKDI